MATNHLVREEPRPCGLERPHHDHMTLMQRLGNDESLLVELLAMFRHDVHVRLRELRQAIAANDPVSVAEKAHSVRGMAAIFSADRAVNLAKRLEKRALAGSLADADAHLLLLIREILFLETELENMVDPVTHRSGGRG